MAERILHRNVAVLRVESQAVFDEIAALIPLDDFVIGELSPTERVVDPQRVKELSTLLQANGLAPLLRRSR